MTATVGEEFGAALLAHQVRLELATGGHILLPAGRWRDAPGDGDEWLLDRCTGPTLDVGCGPGRLAAALVNRGVAALGIDSSHTAVVLTRDRGGIALHRNVFDRVPGEGRWRHVLLADGNIGIGGDPVALLRRVGQLVGGGGRALVELDPPGRGVRHERVRVLADAHGPGRWFTWAWLGADAVTEVAAEASLRVNGIERHGQRWFAELAKP